MNEFSEKLIIGLQKSAFPVIFFRLFLGLNHLTLQLFYKKKGWFIRLELTFLSVIYLIFLIYLERS